MTCLENGSTSESSDAEENNTSSHPIVRELGKKIVDISETTPAPSVTPGTPWLSLGDIPNDPQALGDYARAYHRGVEAHIAEVVARYFEEHPDERPPTPQN